MKNLELVLRNMNNAYVPFITYNPQENDVLVDESDNYDHYQDLKLAALRRQTFHAIEDINQLMNYTDDEFKTIFSMLQKPGGEEAVKYYVNLDKERVTLTSIFSLYDMELDEVDSFIDYKYDSLFSNLEVGQVSELCVRLNSKNIFIDNTVLIDLMTELENIGLFTSSKYYALYGKKHYTVVDMVEHMLEYFSLEEFRKIINDAKIVDINEFFHIDVTASEKIISTILFFIRYGIIDTQLATFVREYGLEVTLAKRLLIILNGYPVKHRHTLSEIKYLKSIEQLSHGVRLYKKLVEVAGDSEVKFHILSLATLPTGSEYIGRALSLYRQFHTVLNVDTFFVFKKLVERPTYQVTPNTIKAIYEVPDLFDYIDLGFTDEEIVAYKNTTEFYMDLKPLLLTIKSFRDMNDNSFELKYRQHFNM